MFLLILRNDKYGNVTGSGASLNTYRVLQKQLIERENQTTHKHNQNRAVALLTSCAIHGDPIIGIKFSTHYGNQVSSLNALADRKIKDMRQFSFLYKNIIIVIIKVIKE